MLPAENGLPVTSLLIKKDVDEQQTLDDAEPTAQSLSTEC